MPFKSDKQRRYLYSQKPEVAKKFAAHKAMGGPLSPMYKDDGGVIDLGIQDDALDFDKNREYPEEVQHLLPTSGWGRTVGSILGGGAGALTGGVFGTPVAAIPGGAAGSAGGGALGEQAEAYLTGRKAHHTGADVLEDALLGSIPGGVAKAGKAVYKGAGKAGKVVGDTAHDAVKGATKWFDDITGATLKREAEEAAAQLAKQQAHGRAGALAAKTPEAQAKAAATREATRLRKAEEARTAAIAAEQAQLDRIAKQEWWDSLSPAQKKAERQLRLHKD